MIVTCTFLVCYQRRSTTHKVKRLTSSNESKTRIVHCWNVTSYIYFKVFTRFGKTSSTIERSLPVVLFHLVCRNQLTVWMPLSVLWWSLFCFPAMMILHCMSTERPSNVMYVGCMLLKCRESLTAGQEANGFCFVPKKKKVEMLWCGMFSM